jgi:hypothetical protein
MTNLCWCRAGAGGSISARAQVYAARRCAESAFFPAKILYRSSNRQTAGMALGTIILRYLIR